MSITNARQYRISKAQLARFQQAIEAGEKARYDEPGSGHERIVDGALVEQARQQAADLHRLLEEYERIAARHDGVPDSEDQGPFPGADQTDT